MLSLCGPWTRLGAALSALIVVFSIIGMTMHIDFYTQRKRKDFFCFYTNVSNLAVLLYFGLAAPQLYTHSTLRAWIPHAEFAVMMSIMLTFCVFHLVLYPPLSRAAKGMPHTREFLILYADNFIIHYLVPLSVFVYWLLCSPQKQKLGAADAIYWTSLPLIYIACIFLRAKRRLIIEETGSPYPYPFLDIQALGAKRVVGICTALYTLCILAGLGMISLIGIIGPK